MNIFSEQITGIVLKLKSKMLQELRLLATISDIISDY